MRRFQYVFDPVCLIGCALYAANRWGIKPHTNAAFFRFWFNDLLLIPCALPPLLQIHRWLRLRSNHAFPTPGEIFGHLIFWCVLFEGIGPRLMRGTTGDFFDVCAYTAGAIAALICWHPKRLRESVPS